MPTLEEMRDALITTIKNELTEINGYPTHRDVLNVPAVVIGAPEAEFDLAMGRGLDKWTFPLFVMVGIPDLDTAQRNLDKYVNGSGPKSIRRIIWENPSLGNVVQDCRVSLMKDYGAAYETAKIPHVGATLVVEILSTGDDD